MATSEPPPFERLFLGALTVLGFIAIMIGALAGVFYAIEIFEIIMR